MKKIFNMLVLTAIFVSYSHSVGVVVAAPLQAEAVFTFENLGLPNDMVLNGPFDVDSIRFELAPTWQLNGQGELELIISSFFTGNSGSDTSTTDEFTGAALEVYFNDQLQQTISLRSGTNITYTVPILAEDIASPYDDGSFKISFFLDAAIDCDFDFHQTTVAISLNSKANLPYTEVPLPLDLHRLPWPFYQTQTSTADPVTVVVPAAASSKEIQGALVVMGIFGRSSSGKLPLSLVTMDALSEDTKARSNLIFVGKPAGFPELASIKFPVAIAGGKFASAELGDGDGVLQLAASPWNKDKAILVVGGNTDDAVVKAAQALSTGNLQTGAAADYSVVAEVNPITMVGILGANQAPLSSPDFTFADLGYSSETLSDLGTNWFSYNFSVPPGQIPSDIPSLNVLFSHSALLDVNRSDVSIYFNDVLSGSIKLSDENYNLVSTEIKLPISAVKPGLNNISISANLIPRDDCSLSSFTGLWMTVYSDSKLHLPLTSAPVTAYALQDLNSYPYPFVNDPNLSSTMFVLPPNDPNAWAAAGNLAYHLGRNSTGSILNLSTVFDGELTDATRSNDLIIVGLPSQLKIMSELKDSMPASFEEGSNIAILKSQQVIYRISANKNLGYLELFTSPWDQERAILSVLGTTPDGVNMAAAALLTSKSRDVLNGDFATVDGVRPIVVDTRTGSGMGRVSSEIGEDNIQVQQNPTAAPVGVSPTVVNASSEKRLILFGLIGTFVLILIIAIVAIRLRRASR